MSDNINLEILDKAKEWFRNIIAVNHISNTKKLKDSSEFNINPFLAVYLANFLTGNYAGKKLGFGVVEKELIALAS